MQQQQEKTSLSVNARAEAERPCKSLLSRMEHDVSPKHVTIYIYKYI